MIKNTTKAFRGGYESPDAKTVSMNASGFICQSGTVSIRPFTYDDSDEDELQF